MYLRLSSRLARVETMRKFGIVLIALLILAIVAGAVGCGSTSDNGSGVYVGSKNSNIYHYPSCEWAKKISSQNEIWFDSVTDAKAHGYRACKVCKPPG